MYEGTYTDGKRAGTGKMTYPNGDCYTGEWKDNMMEGEGTYVYKVGIYLMFRFACDRPNLPVEKIYCSINRKYLRMS